MNHRVLEEVRACSLLLDDDDDDDDGVRSGIFSAPVFFKLAKSLRG